jgi:chaperonin cofactor prefoldin
MKIEINETIQEIEKGIAEIKGILKDASLKLSRNIGNHTLTPAEKENLWLALEVMEDDLNEKLENAGLESKSWDW